MSVSDEKKKLRKEIIRLKKTVSAEQKALQSQAVVRLIEADADFQKATVVLAYWPLNDEVDLRPLIRHWSHRKRFLLPQIENRHLVLKFFEGEEKMVAESVFGILEPQGPAFSDFERIDLVLVPGLAFNAQGLRLGRGGGYYDKLLPQLPTAVRIGVGFSFQLVQDVPCESHDEVLDRVLTPSG